MEHVEFDDACRFLLKDHDPSEVDRLISSLHTFLATEGKSGGAFEALDINLSGRGGKAFFWKDIFALGEALDMAEEFGIEMLSPPEAAQLILHLAKVWHRLRKVRVDLNENEFKVLRAIKKGRSSVESIAEYTDLTDGEVGDAIATLKEKKYKEEIPLLEQEGEHFSTQF